MKAIRHTGIVVSSLDKAIHFYRDILGLKVEKEKTESGEYIDRLLARKNIRVKTVKMSAEDGNLIELLCYRSRPRKTKDKDIFSTGYSHIAFTVKDLDYEYKRLKKKGIRFNSTPRISPNGKAKVVFCRDPEGNLIELAEELG